MTVETPQADLVERVRNLLTNESTTREVAMFGGRSFMVNEKMVVSALKDGDLLVRIPAERHHELVAQPGAVQAEMGAGRSMGPGWISVSKQSIANDAQLAFWLDVALRYNRETAGS
jgi:TfoX/Sxy family transcriptional regulator of competence genes